MILGSLPLGTEKGILKFETPQSLGRPLSQTALREAYSSTHSRMSLVSRATVARGANLAAPWSERSGSQVSRKEAGHDEGNVQVRRAERSSGGDLPTPAPGDPGIATAARASQALHGFLSVERTSCRCCTFGSDGWWSYSWRTSFSDHTLGVVIGRRLAQRSGGAAGHARSGRNPWSDRLGRAWA